MFLVKLLGISRFLIAPVTLNILYQYLLFFCEVYSGNSEINIVDKLGS
jgi:uncharacterized membrane protein YqhA